MSTSAEDLPIRLRIDVKNLTIGAQIDFEEAKEAESLRLWCDWLVKYAGAQMAELREMTTDQFVAVFEEIAEEMGKLQPSKVNGATSSSPSRRGGVARRRG